MPISRSDAPSLALPPHYEFLLRETASDYPEKLTDLHRGAAFRMVASLVGSRYNSRQVSKIADETLAGATDVKTLITRLDDLAKRMRQAG